MLSCVPAPLLSSGKRKRKEENERPGPLGVSGNHDTLTYLRTRRNTSLMVGGGWLLHPAPPHLLIVPLQVR